MTWDLIAQFTASSLRASTPLIFVALGAVFSFRAGIFHLGLEGLMLVGAFASVVGTAETGSISLGLLIAVVACMVVSALMWVVIVKLQADPVIAGLGLSTLCYGGTSCAQFVIYESRGAIYVEQGLWRPVSAVTGGPLLMVSDISILVYLTPLATLVVWVLLRRTRFGLNVSTVGEFPFAAASAGINVNRTKLIALLITGALCALGGAELALGSLRSFGENMTQGRGFIGFTAVVFGAGHPIGSAAAGLFFGVAEALGIQSQLATVGLPIPLEIVLSLPYVLTIFAVWYTSVKRKNKSSIASYGELRG